METNHPAEQSKEAGSQPEEAKVPDESECKNVDQCAEETDKGNEEDVYDSKDADSNVGKNEDIKDDSGSKEESENKAKDPFVVEEDDPDGWVDLFGSGRVKKRVVCDGDKEEPRPSSGDEVVIHFKVLFEDQMVLEESDYTFVIGEAEVIKCLDLVVPLMHPGEESEVVTDPEFAYGKLGLPSNNIPGSAALNLNVRLLSVEPNLDPEALDMDRRMAVGRRKKQRGNFWYAREEYSEAIQTYRKSTDYFVDSQLDFSAFIDRYSLPEPLQEVVSGRIKTFNNLAMSQIKIEAWDMALASLKQVLKIEPNNEKALYRKSVVYREKGLYDESMGLLRRVTRLYPENAQAKNDLNRMSLLQKKSKEAETRMSRKMLGLDKNGNKSASAGILGSFWPPGKTGISLGLAVGAVGTLMGGVLAYHKLAET